MLTGHDFENEVRCVARALWAADPGDGGARIELGRERDCFFELPDITHYLECTSLNTIAKVRADAAKMRAYKASKPNRKRLVKLWIVTKFEPTAEQRDACKDDIEILSLKEFRRKVFDGTQYLEIRGAAPFGSARDPKTGSSDVRSLR